MRVEGDIHGALRLITDHYPKDCRAYGAFDPILLTDEVFKTAEMELVKAFKHVDVMVVLLEKLLFELCACIDLKLVKTNRANLVLNFGLSQLKLERWIILEVEFFLYFSCAFGVFLIGK